MPELPDVEGWKRYVKRYATGRRIKKVQVHDPRILKNVSPSSLGRWLSKQRVGDPNRHGKWLITPIGKGLLVFHFGMTGELSWSSEDEDHPECDLALILDGGVLGYRARRKLGGIWWTRGDLSGVTGPLGPDAARVSAREFHQRLSDRKGTLKGALMDQELVAGIGNELSDEIAWHLRVPPDVQVKSLSEVQVEELYDTMKRVLKSSMKHGRIPTAKQWFKSVRGEEDPKCPRCGTRVKTKKRGGRTAYWCPKCQR